MEAGPDAAVLRPDAMVYCGVTLRGGAVVCLYTAHGLLSVAAGLLLVARVRP